MSKQKKNRTSRLGHVLKAQMVQLLADRNAVSDARGEAEVSYERCIVSFIDVLGFRAMIASRSAAEINDVLLKLRESSAPHNLVGRAIVDSVSDAIVRVREFHAEYRDGALFHELLDLLHVQMQCILSGVLIRAGVAIGDVHIGNRVQGPVFGPAMVRAFDVENEEALFPRIVVDEASYQDFCRQVRAQKAEQDALEEIRHVDRLLRVGEDGTRFIDYLLASESEFEETLYYFDFLGIHAELIRKGLAEATKAGVWRKYTWLARYHNDVIETLLRSFRSNKGTPARLEREWDADPISLLEALRVAFLA